MAKEYIGMAKGLAKGSHIEWSDIENILGDRTKHFGCPAGGKYDIGVLGVDPVCSVSNHNLPYFYQFEEYKIRSADQKRFVSMII